jgi:predicted chitinase/LysM repeat protein
MRAREFSIVEKKRRKRKSRWAAYGPGPYGGYGYLVGYSGDSGGDGGGVGEASYEGNLGMMELAKFFKIADDAKKKLFRDLIEKGKKGLAWKLVQDTTGTKLKGQEFQEDRTADVEFSTGEKKRIRYVPTGKDIVDTLIRYYLKQGLKVVRVDNTKVNWNLAKEEYSYETVDEGWRDTLAGLALGAGVALGSGAVEANVEKVEVSKGDTVYSIAKAFGTTPQIIQKLNKLDKDFTIKPGQTVKVPAADAIDIKDTPSKEKKAEPEKKKESGKKTQSTLDVSKTLTGTTHEAILTRTARAAGITNPIELAAFLAQCAHESHDFKSMVEYGGSLDFRKYDPKYAPRKARALGNTKAGDGARYKGRGYIQLTGRYNYKRAGQALGIPLEKNPQLAEKPEIAAKIAVWFWQQRVQPNVDNFNDVRAVTKPINPGLNGLEDRKEAFVDFKKFKTAQR